MFSPRRLQTIHQVVYIPERDMHLYHYKSHLQKWDEHAGIVNLTLKKGFPYKDGFCHKETTHQCPK